MGVSASSVRFATVVEPNEGGALFTRCPAAPEMAWRPRFRFAARSPRSTTRPPAGRVNAPAAMDKPSGS